ncbi:MAG: hypothetical protein OEW08_13575 [Gammaproteobacteria bacterium]|nr:hypothetical protein [Gammaproteobacteria bacterium]
MKKYFLSALLLLLSSNAIGEVTAEDAERFQDEITLQPYFYLGFGHAKFKAGSAINQTTKEVSNVYLNPASADGFGVKVKYNVDTMLDIVGGAGYNSAHVDQTIKDADASFSWINYSGSLIVKTPNYYVFLKSPLRWYGGLGFDYYNSPELIIKGWANVNGKYTSKIGYHALLGTEFRDKESLSVFMEARYRVATVESTSMQFNGAIAYDLVAPDGTHLRTMNLSAIELALGLNWYF